MFSVINNGDQIIYIQNSGHCKGFLHSDGSVFRTVEYFPTQEAAQAVLDKFYPKPKHEWEHGDVFENSEGMWIYLVLVGGPIVAYLKMPNMGGTPHIQLDGAEFLFNIKEKI